MKKVLLLAFVVFLAVMFGMYALTKNSQFNIAKTSTVSTPAPAPAQPRETKPDTEKVWTEVTRFTGTTQKRSDTFILSGKKTRLKYTQDGNAFTAVYVIAEGDSLAKSGGMPEATMSAPITDETMLVKGYGSYYFDVNSSGGSTWSLVIEELK